MPSFLTRYFNRRALRSKSRERRPARRPQVEQFEGRVTPTVILAPASIQTDIPPTSSHVQAQPGVAVLKLQSSDGNSWSNGYAIPDPNFGTPNQNPNDVYDALTGQTLPYEIAIRAIAVDSFQVYKDASNSTLLANVSYGGKNTLQVTVVTLQGYVQSINADGSLTSKFTNGVGALYQQPGGNSAFKQDDPSTWGAFPVVNGEPDVAHPNTPIAVFDLYSDDVRDALLPGTPIVTLFTGDQAVQANVNVGNIQPNGNGSTTTFGNYLFAQAGGANEPALPGSITSTLSATTYGTVNGGEFVDFPNITPNPDPEFLFAQIKEQLNQTFPTDVTVQNLDFFNAIFALDGFSNLGPGDSASGSYPGYAGTYGTGFATGVDQTGTANQSSTTYSPSGGVAFPGAIDIGSNFNGVESNTGPTNPLREVRPGYLGNPPPNQPTITTTPSPTSITLPGDGSTVTLSDTAHLTGGSSPTGSITFTLNMFDSSTNQYDIPVGSDTYTGVNGDGDYTTPNGVTLPTSGTVAGNYQWEATYNGDTNNSPASDDGDSAEDVTVNPASPQIATTASGNITLGTTAPTISDTLTLSGGYFPTGKVTFTLTGPGSFTYSQSDSVSSNGTYTASTTLPTSGTVAGTYTWSASYSGDANNNSTSEAGNSTNGEQTVVSPASPQISTKASDNITLGATAPTISDTLTLSGGYYPGGKVTFTLTGPGSFTYSQSDSVSSNGSYTASTTLPTSGTVAGTYTWSASYSGDANNNSTSEAGNSTNGEQTVVSPASPQISTKASDDITLGTTAPTISDTLTLSGGYYPGGKVTFTLAGPGGFTYSQSDSVSSNGTYTASTTLPTSGTVAGTYTWSASYSGDANNNSTSEAGNSTNGEQTVVTAASPSISTTASNPITLGTTAPTISDSLKLSGGYLPTGKVTFTLTGPGSFTYSQSDAVSGNGTYTASTTLPTSGTVAGTYTWSASYSGDANNKSTNEAGNSTNGEQTVVTAASPQIKTTSNPTGTVNVGDTAITVTDTIVVSNAYYIGGQSLTVTLTGPGGFSFTTSVKLTTTTGNGTYTVSDLLQPGTTQLGTYTWTVSYGGDVNNNSASDQGGQAEQFTLQNGVAKNEAATLGFWANKNGQKLLSSYTSALGYWLGTTYHNLFGNLAGTTQAASASGATIASYFMNIVKASASGVVYNTYAQALTVALDVWVTTTGLGWNGANQLPKSATSATYGFMQGFKGAGLGDIYYNVGNNGTSFGMKNNSNVKVSDLLSYFNSQTHSTGGGTPAAPTLPMFTFYGNNDPTLLNGANNVFSGITQTGDIT
jgi:hypothetical protein